MCYVVLHPDISLHLQGGRKPTTQLIKQSSENEVGKMNRKEKGTSQGAGCITDCQCPIISYPEPLFKHCVTVVVWIVNVEPWGAPYT